MINGSIAIFCIPMMHTPFSLMYVIRLSALVKFNFTSTSNHATYKTKFKITKTAYGTSEVSDCSKTHGRRRLTQHDKAIKEPQLRPHPRLHASANDVLNELTSISDVAKHVTYSSFNEEIIDQNLGRHIAHQT